MIDWKNLAANSLWIMGCAAALATLSYAIWMVSMRQKMLRTILTGYQIQIVLNLSGILFCIGLAATSDAFLEILIWLLLGFIFAAQEVIAILKNRKKNTDPSWYFVNIISNVLFTYTRRDRVFFCN